MPGVSAAALVAARVGAGAVALAPQLAKLVASLAGCGKLLVAARSPLGDAIAILGAMVPATQDGTLRLLSGAHDLVLGTEGIGSCYLLEDLDAHGHTLSLNWFDGRGSAIGRIFIASRPHWPEARSQLEAYALPDQRRTLPQPDAGDPATIRHERRPADGNAIASGEGAGRLMTRAVLALKRLPSVRLDLEGRGAALRFDGPLARTSRTPPAVQATSEGCKLHARPLEAVAAWRCEAPGEAPGLRFADDGGGMLTLTPRGKSGAADAWASGLIEASAA